VAEVQFLPLSSSVSVPRPPASPSISKPPSLCPQELEGYDEPPHDLIPKLQSAMPILCGLGSVQFKLTCLPRKRTNKSFTLTLLVDQQMLTISARAYAHHGLSNRPWVDVPCWMCSVTCARTNAMNAAPAAVLMHGKLGLSRQLIRLTHARALGSGSTIDLKAFESFPHDSPGCDTHLLSLSAEYTLHFFGPRHDAFVRLLECRKEGAFDVSFFNADGANIDLTSFSLGPPPPSVGYPAAAQSSKPQPQPRVAYHPPTAAAPAFGPVRARRKTRLPRLARSSVSHAAAAKVSLVGLTTPDASTPACFAILPGFTPSLPNFMAASNVAAAPSLFSSALSVAPSPTELASLPPTVFELPDKYAGSRLSTATPPDSASIADTVFELSPGGAASLGAVNGMNNEAASLFHAMNEEFKPCGLFLPPEHLPPLFGVDTAGVDLGLSSFSFPPASEYFPPLHPPEDSLFSRDPAPFDFLSHSY